MITVTYQIPVNPMIHYFEEKQVQWCLWASGEINEIPPPSRKNAVEVVAEDLSLSQILEYLQGIPGPTVA